MHHGLRRPIGFPVLYIEQQHDTATVAAMSKFYSGKPPLSHFTQLLVWWAEHFRVQLMAAHVAGCENDWADGFSRLTPSIIDAADPSKRIHISIQDLLLPFSEAEQAL